VLHGAAQTPRHSRGVNNNVAARAPEVSQRRAAQTLSAVATADAEEASDFWPRERLSESA
jgi:hypothetical protein